MTLTFTIRDGRLGICRLEDPVRILSRSVGAARDGSMLVVGAAGTASWLDRGRGRARRVHGYLDCVASSIAVVIRDEEDEIVGPRSRVGVARRNTGVCRPIAEVPVVGDDRAQMSR